MPNYHADLIWQLDKFLGAASFFLALLLLVYSAAKIYLARRRFRQLALLKIRLEQVAATRDLSAGNRCHQLIGKGPLETQADSRQMLLSAELKEQLKVCFSAQGSLDMVRGIALGSKNKWRRIQAIIMLGSLGEAGTGALEKGIADKDEDVVYFSMLALGQTKDVRAGKILLDFLGKHVYSGQKIVSLLEDFPAGICAEIVKSLQDPDPSVRFWLLKLLAKFKPAQYLKQVIPLTLDASPDVRSAACQCLAESGAGAKEALVNRLGDEVWFVRMQAVRALAGILKGPEMEIIKPALNDQDSLVRETAKISLNRGALHDS